MPWLNRHVGNPILTGLLNVLFGVKISDAHCGMRAVRRDALETLDLHSTGMEFASEMVFKAFRREAPRERDPDRLLPAGRGVEAQPLRRRLAAREVHAPLQPELALLRPRARAPPAGRDRGDRARDRPGDAPRSHLADPRALRLHRRGAARHADRPARGLRPRLRRLAPRRDRRPRRLGTATPERRARPRRRRSTPARGVGDRDRDLRRVGARRLRRARSRVHDRVRLHARRGRHAGDPRLVLPRPAHDAHLGSVARDASSPAATDERQRVGV